MKRTVLILLLILLGAVPARPQFRISRIEPQTRGDRLCAAVRMEDALTVKIEQTLRSGLPAIVEFRILLADSRKRTLRRSAVHFRILSDIWKNEFRVEGPGRMRVFRSYDSLRCHFRALDGLPVAPMDLLPPERPCRIWIQAEVTPISASQGDKVRDWLVQPDGEEPRFSSGSRSEGFKLSLSGLIGSLFSREKKRELQTDWACSDPFTGRPADE